MKIFRKFFFVISGLALSAVSINNPSSLFFSLSDNSVLGIMKFIIQILLDLVGTISLLFIIIGGFQYITSAGNEEQAAAGKKTLTNAIIGLTIVILSYVIVVAIANTIA